MNRMIAGYLVLAALVLASLVHAASYYQVLPERVVSHLNGHGQADGWMGKGAFIAVYVGMVLGTAAIFLLIGLLLPRIRNSMINLPNKDYWLSPERKRATCAALSAYLAWFGCATIVLLIVSFQACFAVTSGQQLPWGLFPWLMGVYLAFTTLWCVRLFWRFRKPKDG